MLGGSHAWISHPFAGTNLLHSTNFVMSDYDSAISTQVGAEKELRTVIEGESLFNDGSAYVLFLLFRVTPLSRTMLLLKVPAHCWHPYAAEACMHGLSRIWQNGVIFLQP